MAAGSVGFIGLGVMGSAMSSHLLEAGYRVAGFDTDPARRAEHGDRGGQLAASPAEVAAQAGIIVTSLPSTGALNAVLTGADGLAWGPRPGPIVIETSTLDPQAKEEARAALAKRGGWLLDCPMSGTGAQARNKDLVAYLSGDDAAKAQALPVVAAMTRRVYDVGPFGNGSRMKIVANLLVTVHNLAAAEALLLAERAGLDPAAVLEAVGDGAGTSRMFEVRGPAMAAGDYSQPGIRASVFAKDIDIIARFAAGLSSPTPLFTVASAFYQAALDQGRGEEDTSCVHAVLKQLPPGPGQGESIAQEGNAGENNAGDDSAAGNGRAVDGALGNKGGLGC
ncbi:MAG TPA: NAD(P)-dependent oxidoreductase [Streptosporangiaceae bacterium]|nr:NAD(P)-dependent oxidoreductase [Streptosporangiaceae bacterium]